MDPIVTAVSAILLAALRLAGWLAMGSQLVGRLPSGPVTLPVGVLVASAITAFLYAVFSSLGAIPVAIALDFALVTQALVFRGRDVWTQVQELGRIPAKLFREHAAVRIIAIVAVATYVLNAATPAYDVDSLSYHLAHIQQIQAEGIWRPQPILHYALPFGWTMTNLPFIWLEIPEAAQMVNTLTWLLLLASIVSMLGRWLTRGTVLLFLCGMALQRTVVWSVHTPGMDLYLILCVTVVAMLLDENRESAIELRLLGFSAVIGMQGRYQAAAVGLAAGAVVLVRLWRKRNRWRHVTSFTQGALIAGVLASPFYLANWIAFDNPFWPLLVHAPESGASDYTQRVAVAFGESVGGTRALSTWARSIWLLLSDRGVFPIPVLAVIGCALGMRFRNSRRTGIPQFGLAFLAIWVAAHPALYPRYSVYFAGLVMLVWTPLIHVLDQQGIWRVALRFVFGTMLGGFLIFAALGTWPSLRYLTTGDQVEFHRYTGYRAIGSWVNQNTPVDSRLLVILWTRETYYFRRYYRRADPAASGIVDWPRQRTANQLSATLRDLDLDYIIYEPNRNWSSLPGGTEMMNVLKAALAAGTIRVERVIPTELSIHRYPRRVEKTEVWILRAIDP